MQGELGARSRDPGGALRFRIGIHLGDVMVDGDDLLGEGVNLAARLQTMAEPGGVLISQQVYDQVQHKLSVGFEYLGVKRPKNFAEDVPVYRVALGKKARRRGAALGARKAGPVRTPDDAPAARAPPRPSADVRERVIRHAKQLGVIWAVLLVIDLVTGAPFWAHWPGVGIAALVALEAAPLLVSGWFKLQYLRSLVIVVALALVNLFSWSGYLWVMWPAGALLAIELLRRVGGRSH